MNLNQIIKVIFAGIFTFIVIGSLSSISNSIFIEKVLVNFSSISSTKFNNLKEEFFITQSKLKQNQKSLSHTVVGRKELVEEINKQESRLNELSYFSSAEDAAKYLIKLNDELEIIEGSLSHSILKREELIEKIEQKKADILSFQEIVLSNKNMIIDINPTEKEIPKVEKIAVVEKPKLSFEEELAIASIDAGLKLSKKCTACHSLKSGGPNRVGPTLWNIVNAPKAKIDGFSYSEALSSIGGTWTIQDLNLWLKSPKKYAPGNAMSFAGFRKTKDRANMIAFLNSISDEPIQNNGLN